MKELDLTKILKNCPKGTEFFSNLIGTLFFECISHIDGTYPVRFKDKAGNSFAFTTNGKYATDRFNDCNVCIFPSKEQRDWSKFTAPWYKKDKFDPNTLKPFDRVLVRNFKAYKWKCEHFSYFNEGNDYPCICSSNSYAFCIPYNDETKHLVGTSNEAPEYYRYWED